MAIRSEKEVGKVFTAKKICSKIRRRGPGKKALFSIVNKPAVQDFRFRFYDKKPESEIAAAGVRYVKIEYRRVFGGSASEEGRKNQERSGLRDIKFRRFYQGRKWRGGKRER